MVTDNKKKTLLTRSNRYQMIYRILRRAISAVATGEKDMDWLLEITADVEGRSIKEIRKVIPRELWSVDKRQGIMI